MRAYVTEENVDRSGRRYHHGDLPAALIAAGLELARAGGPEAVSLREVTRSAGVTANAAYRHFADRHALVLAVAARAEQHLALAMEDRMALADADADPASRAGRRLRALGLAYIGFAVEEPGWFRLAFHAGAGAGPPDTAPYRLLIAALDDLVAVGVLSAGGRPNAAWACWSAVHGFAELATQGPLRGHPAAEVRELAEYVVDTAVHGVIARPEPGR
ncbi:TetR/AcrR family transcriptional regulator [Phytomonospora sp. NPDC050363]|uniref:TetR/AcrR family transcriptional regulator n=1 Tax=Phytomonospora sp. NPDC050363 TaxID=3155642 RepID=UPI0033F523FB